MKRNAKQNGSGGRLRLTLLMAATAAFLLVPAAAAYAAEDTTISGMGEGYGWVKGASSIEDGVPPIECHWNGEEEEWDVGTSVAEGTGVEGLDNCGTEAEGSGLTGIGVTTETDIGSEVSEIEVADGTEIACSPSFCSAILPPIEIKVTFACEGAAPCPPPANFTLTTSTSGTAGSVECKIDGGSKGACPEGVEEVAEGSSVEMFAEPGAESDFAEWTTGPCEGESTNPCSFTMEGDTSANAEFTLKSLTLSVTESGEGEVTCEVNSTPASCNDTYSYGDSIAVAAEPDAENVVGSITGSGSAEGECGITGEGGPGEGASCAFALTSNSSVDVLFESAGTKATTPATVEGEVPITTSLEGCEAPVVLGPFVPAVVENYLGDCGLTVTSTGNETELRASDPDETATKGHLVQPPYKLPSALETRATGLGGLEFPGTGFSFAPLTSDVTLLEYGGPVSADNVTVFFRQHIGLHDALHTGTYSKTLTLTLEQTA